MSQRIFIFGAGGHARVCADALLCAGQPLAGFVEREPTAASARLMGLPVVGEGALLASEDRAEVAFVIGFGGTGLGEVAAQRQAMAARLRADGWAVRGVRHPSAIVSASARVADDAQLMARAVVQPMAQIAEGAIINTAAVVEHDAQVGAYSHISIGAILCGHVVIGARTHIGAGAVIRQGITLGDEVIVGAGAAVVQDHAGPATLTGVPARQMDKR